MTNLQKPNKPTKSFKLNSFTIFYAALGVSAVLQVKSCNAEKEKEEKAQALRAAALDTATLRTEGAKYTSLPSQAIEWTKKGNVLNIQNLHTLNISSESYTVDLKLKNGSNTIAILNSTEFKQLFEAAQNSNVEFKTSIVQPATEQFITLQSNKPWYEPFLIPTVILAGFFFVRRGLNNLGNSIGTAISHMGNGSDLGLEEFKPSVKFQDIGGSKIALSKLMPIVEGIKEFVNSKGKSKPPAKAVLLYGPPGTGKSFIGSAVAGEAQCPVISTSASELTSEPFIGSWGKKIHALFEKARTLRDQDGACVIIIDEAELLAMSRGIKAMSSNSEQQRAVTALLTELDGPKSIQNAGITVIYTTNYKDRVDDALLRPGRCPVQIEIGLPTVLDDRIDIFQKLLVALDPESKVTITNEQLELLGRLSDGLTPDQMKSLTDAIVRDNQGSLESAKIIEAIQDVILGNKSGVKASIPKRTLVAAHELGHAFMGGLVGGECYAISMTPRGESLGHVLVDNSSFLEQPYTRDDILKAMLIKAGGRAGEIAYGEGKFQLLSTGVSSDFDGLGQLASTYISSGMDDGRWGMSTFNIEQSDMPPEVRAKVDAIASSAIHCAADLLSKMNETFKKSIDEVIALSTELTGKDASSFINERLSPIKSELDLILNKFLENPIEYASASKGVFPT